MILGLQILNMAYKELGDNVLIGRSRVVHILNRKMVEIKLHVTHNEERTCMYGVCGSLW